MMLTIVIIVLFLLLFFAAAGAILWRYHTTRKLPVFLCLFLILPLGQAFLLYSLSFSEWSVFWVLGLILSIAAIVLLLIHTGLQEEKSRARDALQEMQHRRNLEKAHFAAVEQRRAELDEIQNDFHEKLETIAALIRTGGEDAAREGISELAEKIARTRENPYCSIPVINAVLTEKAHDCADAGIALSIQLHLPDMLDIESTHLCSIFSNLLDNAIAACKQLQIEKKPVIHLTSMVDGDYLFIKSVNPSAPPSKQRLPGRGYGSRILADLAARYGGSYQSSYHGGEFISVMALLGSSHAKSV